MKTKISIVLVALLTTVTTLICLDFSENNDTRLQFADNASKSVPTTISTTSLGGAESNKYPSWSGKQTLQEVPSVTELDNKMFVDESLILDIRHSNSSKVLSPEMEAENIIPQVSSYSIREKGARRSADLMVRQIPVPLVVKSTSDIPVDNKLRSMSITSATTGLAASTPMFAPVNNGATLPPPPFTTYREDQLGLPLGDGLIGLLLMLMVYALYIKWKR